MIDATTLGLFALASAAVVAVPGPTVTVIVANSLSRGVRAGLMNVVGTQLGLALMLTVLAAGFAAIVAGLAPLFDLIRVVGAIYLVWLGWRLWRANGATFAAVDEAEAAARAERTNGSPGRPGGADGSGPPIRLRTARTDPAARRRADLGHVVQGFLVIWSNPKALFFFGAFIPQFVDPALPAAPQVLLLGALFMVIGTALDSLWALAAARASGWLGPGRARLVERLGGGCLAGGGVWLLASGQGA